MTNFRIGLATALLYVSILSFGTLKGYGQVPDFARLDDQLRALIKDKATPDHLLLEAISRLGKISEPPDFWTKIANDPSYSIQHRTRAVFALFRRHAEQIGELHLLGEFLQSPKWLQESSITKIPFVFGSVPVEANVNQSIFVISVFYGSSIYIRLSSKVEEGAVRPILSRKVDLSSAKDLIILQYGYDDDYEKWLRSPSPVKQEESPPRKSP